MKILITGAGGLIGSHLARQLAGRHEVIALNHRELDITDRWAVKDCFTSARPQAVLNCAVNEVDDCERNPKLGRAINLEGPRNLAESASAVGAECVHFSTNYVFDGQEVGRSPYTIRDEPRPVNVYGRTKLLGEQEVSRACPRSYIVRTSWVYGHGKKTFLSTVHSNLREGNRVRPVSDVWASTTYVMDLVERVGAIIEVGRHGTYHLVNEGVCSNYEFALEAGRLLGIGPERLEDLIEPISEAEAKRLAPRPRYTPMRCLLSEEIGLAPMRDWHTALAAYVGTAHSNVSQS